MKNTFEKILNSNYGICPIFQSLNDLVNFYNSDTDRAKALHPRPLFIRFIKTIDVKEYNFFTAFVDLEEYNASIEDLKDNGCLNAFELVYPQIHETKPYLDFDIPDITEDFYNEHKDEYLNKIISDIIKAIKLNYGITISKDDIKILESSGVKGDSFKMSYHFIIAPTDYNLLFKTTQRNQASSAHHFYNAVRNQDIEFYDNLNGDVVKKNENIKFLDDKPYNNKQSLRVLYSNKSPTDKRTLTPICPHTFKKIKVKSKNESAYYISYQNQKLDNKILDTIPLNISNKKIKTENNKPTTPTTNIINDVLLKYIKPYHKTAVFKNKEGNIYNFNYTDKTELCPFSGNTHDSNGFYVIEDERGYIMKCHSSDCKKGKKHIGYIPDDEFLKDAVIINSKYLINNTDICEHEKIKTYCSKCDNKDDDDEQIKPYVKEWLTTDNIQTLAVKSPMNTGKTTLIKGILAMKHFKKILWITHRQSLAKNIHGTFGIAYELVSYMDIKNNGCLHPDNYKRVLVSVDSLNRVRKINKEGEFEYPNYDLIIIDEIESVMNHYGASTLNNKKTGKSAEELFNLLEMLIISTNKGKKGKLLLLDADFHQRAFLFMNNPKFGNSILIHNKYKTMNKEFIITNDNEYFFKNIMESLVLKKENIVVVSMNTKTIKTIIDKINDYNNENKTKITFIEHTSKTGDENKALLKNVNTEWIKYNCLLYSPSVDSGVDCNIKHFDRMFCVLEHGYHTTSSRGLIQMIGRVRQIEQAKKDGILKILTLYDTPHINSGLSYFTLDDIIAYDRFNHKITGASGIVYNEIIQINDMENFKIINNTHQNITTYNAIQYLNKTEDMNKNNAIFYTNFCRLAYSKGFLIDETLIIKNNSRYKEKKENMISSTQTKIDEIYKILSSGDKLTPLNELEYKERNNNSTAHEKYEHDAYKLLNELKLSKDFRLDNDNPEQKTQFEELAALQCYGLKTKLKRYEDIYEVHTHERTTKEGSINIHVKDMLYHLTGENNITPENMFNYTISGAQYKKYQENIKEVMYFQNEVYIYNQIFEGVSKKTEPTKVLNSLAINNITQSILDKFNISFTRGGRVMIKGERLFSYNLKLNKDIHDIYQFQKGNLDIVEKYDKIYNRELLNNMNDNPEKQLDKIEEGMRKGVNPFIKHTSEQPIKKKSSRVNILDL